MACGLWAVGLGIGRLVDRFQPAVLRRRVRREIQERSGEEILSDIQERIFYLEGQVEQLKARPATTAGKPLALMRNVDGA